MYEVEKIDNHYELGIARLIEQYKQSVNMKAFIKPPIDQLQDLEDVAYSLYGLYNIDNNSGIYLDQIGGIVGQQRFGFGDDVYRLLIRARIAINVSGGNPENIINIVRLISGSDDIYYFELYPAAFQVGFAGEVDPALESFIVDAINVASPAGVSLDLVVVFDEDTPFTFGAMDGEFDVDRGFGDEGDPNIGGKLGREI